MGTGSATPHRNITDVSLRAGDSQTLVSYSNVWFTDDIKSRTLFLLGPYSVLKLLLSDILPGCFGG